MFLMIALESLLIFTCSSLKVRVASDELDRLLKKEIAAFRDALQGTDGNTNSGQVSQVK